MSSAIGPDLRDRIIDALQSSRRPYATIAARFGVAEITVRRIASANGFTHIGRG